jgi:hypothetical protein
MLWNWSTESKVGDKYLKEKELSWGWGGGGVGEENLLMSWLWVSSSAATLVSGAGSKVAYSKPVVVARKHGLTVYYVALPNRNDSSENPAQNRIGTS